MLVMLNETAYLSDVHNIRTLKFEYCELADLCCSADGGEHAVEEMTALFVDDSTLEVPPNYGGKQTGRDQIRDFWISQADLFRYGDHIVFHDRITVSGDKARGKWKSMFVVTPLNDGATQDSWILGDYDDEYIKVGGIWRIKSVKVSIRRIFS